MKKIILTIFILSIFQISFACDNEKQCIELALENKTDFKTALKYLDEAVKFNEQSERAYYYRALLKFENGKRKVPNKNSNAKRKIYLVGPCTIFGAYVADNQTIEYSCSSL